MTAKLDHIIVHVNDAAASVDFYTKILGFSHEGEDGPFAVIRVAPDFMILLSPFGTQGGGHLAFAMTEADFDQTFDRIRKSGVPFGDSYDTVGSMKGPGRERSARGLGTSVYFFDPNRHLIEIVHYDD